MDFMFNIINKKKLSLILINFSFWSTFGIKVLLGFKYFYLNITGSYLKI